MFSELMKNGHIELSKAAVTAVAIVTPVVDNIRGNYNYKMGVARIKRHGVTDFSFAPRNIVLRLICPLR